MKANSVLGIALAASLPIKAEKAAITGMTKPAQEIKLLPQCQIGVSKRGLPKADSICINAREEEIKALLKGAREQAAVTRAKADSIKTVREAQADSVEKVTAANAALEAAKLKAKADSVLKVEHTRDSLMNVYGQYRHQLDSTRQADSVAANLAKQVSAKYSADSARIADSTKVAKRTKFVADSTAQAHTADSLAAEKAKHLAEKQRISDSAKAAKIEQAKQDSVARILKEQKKADSLATIKKAEFTADSLASELAKQAKAQKTADSLEAVKKAQAVADSLKEVKRAQKSADSLKAAKAKTDSLAKYLVEQAKIKQTQDSIVVAKKAQKLADSLATIQAKKTADSLKQVKHTQDSIKAVEVAQHKADSIKVAKRAKFVADSILTDLKIKNAKQKTADSLKAAELAKATSDSLKAAKKAKFTADSIATAKAKADSLAKHLAAQAKIKQTQDSIAAANRAQKLADSLAKAEAKAKQAEAKRISDSLTTVQAKHTQDSIKQVRAEKVRQDSILNLAKAKARIADSIAAARARIDAFKARISQKDTASGDFLKGVVDLKAKSATDTVDASKISEGNRFVDMSKSTPKLPSVAPTNDSARLKVGAGRKTDVKVGDASVLETEQRGVSDACKGGNNGSCLGALDDGTRTTTVRVGGAEISTTSNIYSGVEQASQGLELSVDCGKNAKAVTKDDGSVVCRDVVAPKKRK